MIPHSAKPELRTRTGSAPAPGAVFRALAENLRRTESPAACAYRRATKWLAARVPPAPPGAGVLLDFAFNSENILNLGRK